MSMMDHGMAAITAPRGGVKRQIAILDLLEWAFAREKAQLEFGGDVVAACGYGYASSTAAIIQHEKLGCRIDGGGSSPCHPDADTVAAAVSVLPEGCGGQRMAVRIAELSRHGQVPHWTDLSEARCEPVEWKRCKHGTFAARVFWDGKGRWPETWLGRDDGFVCPVTYSGVARDVTALRREYLLWWSALLELRETFRLYSGLTAFEVTEAMPPLQPWKKTA